MSQVVRKDDYATVAVDDPGVDYDAVAVDVPGVDDLGKDDALPPKPTCFQPFRGMVQDLKRRAPFYCSDWTMGFHRKVLAASLFMFFTSIAPAITFSAVLDIETRVDGVSQLGPVEVILSTAITSAVFAIFGGQPLCILGVTGPVTIFTIAVFTLAQQLDIDFMPFYCWIQIWGGIMMCSMAIFNACNSIDLVTRYSCETFGMLIATIYVYTGLKNIVISFIEKEQAPALLSLVLAFGTCLLALLLTGARGWSIFPAWLRVLIADYGATISVVIFCLIPYSDGLSSLTHEVNPNATSAQVLTVIDVPTSFGATSGRGWFVDPTALPGEYIAFAIIPAAILTVLFFFDHNVSSLLCQGPQFKLKKGTAYHWDFFMVGILVLVTGLLGIPPVNGLIPQAPLHTDSLCDKKRVTDAHGNAREEVVVCHEQRVSNLMQGVLIGLTLLAIPMIGMLPVAALDGLFLYMGIASTPGNTFFERLVLLFTDPKERSRRGLPYLATVPIWTVHKYTLLQFFILAVIFIVTLLPYVASLFPLFIALLVPLRLLCFPGSFGKENTELLDAPDMSLIEVPKDGTQKGDESKDNGQKGDVEMS